jgi:hypothetical protein
LDLNLFAISRIGVSEVWTNLFRLQESQRAEGEVSSEHVECPSSGDYMVGRWTLIA